MASFTLDDGRGFAGRDRSTAAAPAGESGAQVEAGAAARAASNRSLPVGRRASSIAAAADRYGRTSPSPMSAGWRAAIGGARNAGAGSRGFARVGDRACADELLVQERPRGAKLGLWSEPYYVIVGAENAAELAAGGPLHGGGRPGGFVREAAAPSM
jgi:hypothetical protein